ncbi:MAG: hypothetical protein PUK34_06195, partial [Clostridia bacterium]|nr:hypothetical protein [Clostridia bacterium]
MIRKYVFGNPFETEAVVMEMENSDGLPEFGEFSLENGFSFTCTMEKDDIVYGLGEANRGINK